MRAACYARVSSTAQRERDTIASQLEVLPAFVAARGWTLTETYVDDGRSAKAGKLDARVGLSALLRAAAAGSFDVVVVVDVDRLTRSEDLTERGAILGAFQRAGVKVASASTGQILDLSTSTGDLFGTLAAFFAAEENRKRVERITRGKAQVAARGGKVGGLTPYGLTYDRGARTWGVDAERAAIVRELFERVGAGDSCWALAEDLNRRGVPWPGRRSATWARGRVFDLLKSRHPVGEYVAHRKSRTVVAVPPIVSEAAWQAAQVALAAGRKAALRKTKHVYLLEQLATCGSCGGRMMVRSGCWERGGRRWRPAVYICEHRKYLRVPERCEAPLVLVDDADARAWTAIAAELADPALPAELAADRRDRAADARDWTADAAGYRAHLARLERVRERHLERYRRGLLGDDDLDRELGALNRERAAVLDQLATAERAAGATTTAQARLDEAEATIGRLRARADRATPEERRAIAQQLVRGVVVRGRSMRIELYVARPGEAPPAPPALVDGQFSTSGHERPLRIRVVA